MWDAYIKKAKHGLPQHLSGWRDVLSAVHHYDTCYLLARNSADVVGVLPLFFIRSRLVGHTATTMPGGLCAESKEAALALIERGQALARQAKAKRFVLHDTRQAWPAAPLNTSQQHVHWVVRLTPNVEALWAGLQSNLRRQVRIARRNNLTVEIDRSGHRLGDFYEVFCRFTHQRGTPIFGRNFLEHVIEVFPTGFNIAIVSQGQQTVGAYFQLELGQTMYGVWGASLDEYRAARPAYLAHWELLQAAALGGYRALDMGRSPLDSTAAHYKGQWGGVSKPVYQQVTGFGPIADEASMASRAQSDHKMALMMRLWPKLPPAVVQFLGPKLRRHVPFA